MNLQEAAIHVFSTISRRTGSPLIVLYHVLKGFLILLSGVKVYSRYQRYKFRKQLDQNVEETIAQWEKKDSEVVDHKG